MPLFSYTENFLMSYTIFDERQWVRDTKVGKVLVLLTLFCVATFLYISYSLGLFNKVVVVQSSLRYLIFVLFALWAVFPIMTIIARLSTAARGDGLFIRYFPFHFKEKRIPLENAASVEVVTYNAWKDFGGWGEKRRAKSKCLTVSGNIGVKIKYQDGSDLLIGSQKADELAEAIKSIMK